MRSPTAATLAALLAAATLAAPAVAQSPAPSAATAPRTAPGTGPAVGGTPNTPSLKPANAGRPGAGARTVAAGEVKPGGPTDEAISKAQKEQEARSKAWDTKMKRMMGTVCKGC